MHSPASRQEGQASVEMVATLPLVILVGLLLWQLAVAVHAVWACANAARVAARAAAVDRDAEKAARSALPRRLEDGLRVRELDDGSIDVRVRIPLLLRSLGSIATVHARASLE